MCAYFFECSLCEQVTLDSAECFMRVIISLFYEPKFFSLRLVQTTFYTAIYINIDDSEISEHILSEPNNFSTPQILQFIFWTCKCIMKKNQSDENDTL